MKIQAVDINNVNIRHNAYDSTSGVRDCGWHLIYERLKKLGRLDKMQTMPLVKNYGKMQPPKHLRSTIMWALEQQETKV